MERRIAFTLVTVMALFYSAVTYAQVLHDPAVVHDTINYGSGGNANYAMQAGNANTANYAAQSGNSNTSNYAQAANICAIAQGGNVNYAQSANVCSYASTGGNVLYALNSNASAYSANSNLAVYSTSAGSAAQAANATFAVSAGSSQTALQCGNANTATQSANANFAAVSGSTTGNAATATQCANANIAAYSSNSNVAAYSSNSNISAFAQAANTCSYSANSNLAVYSQNSNLCSYSSNSNLAVYSQNSNLCSYSSNSNLATYATAAGSATTATSATSATNVIAGGNVTTNVVTANTCYSPQYTTNNNVLYMGPTGSPNAFAIASYPDTAFSTTEIGVMVPARVNANSANFNSGALAFGGFDPNHAGLVGQAPNAANATGFTGGSLLLRTGDGGSVNAPYMQAGAYYVPAAGPYHAQNGGTAANPVFQMCNTVVAGAYTQCNGIHSSTGSGLLYLDANSTTVATLGGATNSAAFAGPLSANNITANQNVSVAGQILLPNSGGGNSSSIYFGSRDATGVQIFRLTTGIIGFSLGDASGNAQVYAASFKSLNQGTPAAPQVAYSNAPGYGIHWDSTHLYLDANSAIGAALDGNGSLYGYKTAYGSKTANYTIVATDNAVDFDNNGATGAVAFTLPAPTSGQNNCFTTIANQTITVTTPSGAILGGTFTSGATRTVSAQFTTFCVVSKAANWYIKTLVGTIAS